MSNQICYFKNFKFIDYGNDSFEFVRVDRTLDEHFTFGRYFDAEEAAKKLDLGDVFKYLIPYNRDLGPLMGKEEKEDIENLLIDPKECLELNKKYDLINKLIRENPDFEIPLTAVLENWKKGHYVIVHYE